MSELGEGWEASTVGECFLEIAMGMFDKLRCEYPLPDAEMQDEQFQTKDFYRLLENYLITKAGRLIHDSSYWGKMEVPYTGDLRFYTSKGSQQDNTFEWFEYRADFQAGQLRSVKRASPADAQIAKEQE